MHENPNPAALDGQRDRDLLYLLTTPEDGQPLWAVEDLARELDVPDATPHVRSLIAAGLAYTTCDGYVFASRAGVRAVQMVGHVI
jgi:hypothetical protein